MRSFFAIIVALLFVGFFDGCSKMSPSYSESKAPVDTLWYIDSVYIHRMGISYEEGDSSQDLLMVFRMDDYGDIVQKDEYTDSVDIHDFYDYQYMPDSIIKYTKIDDIEKDLYYSVYELNENQYIKTLTQHLGDLEIRTEYSYNSDGYLSMIYFCSQDQHCKWLWRDGNPERIVWGDGEYITEFRYGDKKKVPFSCAYNELPKLDVVLSTYGLYGRNPKNAVFMTGEMENEELYSVEAMFYDFDYSGVAVRQLCFQDLDRDSVEYTIHWETVEIERK